MAENNDYKYYHLLKYFVFYQMMVCLTRKTLFFSYKCIQLHIWLFLSYILILLTICHQSVRCKIQTEKNLSNHLIGNQFFDNITTHPTISYENLSQTNQLVIESNKSLLQTNESNVCKVKCWCSKKDTLDCRRADHLDSLPVMPNKSDRLQITEM